MQRAGTTAKSGVTDSAHMNDVIEWAKGGGGDWTGQGGGAHEIDVSVDVQMQEGASCMAYIRPRMGAARSMQECSCCPVCVGAVQSARHSLDLSCSTSASSS